MRRGNVAFLHIIKTVRDRVSTLDISDMCVTPTTCCYNHGRRRELVTNYCDEYRL